MGRADIVAVTDKPMAVKVEVYHKNMDCPRVLKDRANGTHHQLTSATAEALASHGYGGWCKDCSGGAE